jgi:citrate synthase
MRSAPGLEGVIAADTVLSHADGEGGRLIIRGHALEQLAGSRSFEDVLQLLLAGFVEPPGHSWRGALGAARVEVFGDLPRGDPRLQQLSPLEALRVLVARLSDGADCGTALRLIAAPAVFTAALIRSRAGLAPLAPDPTLGHTADLLRMLHGRPAPHCAVSALEQYLVTVIDHGLNASTFAARVVASTHAGFTSAVIAALSALKGPLHGGAPGPVLDMLDAIGRPEQAEAWLEQALRRGERLMGFGHRIYRVRDPRADVLRNALLALSTGGRALSARLALAEAVERAALRILRRDKPQRSLETNVEYYTALLLEALDIPREAFTCIFAAGRVGGWIAHASEQVLHGRLIRPDSRYTGPAPQRAA